jgi:hypothetical protein
MRVGCIAVSTTNGIGARFRSLSQPLMRARRIGPDEGAMDPGRLGPGGWR